MVHHAGGMWCGVQFLEDERHGRGLLAEEAEDRIERTLEVALQIGVIHIHLRVPGKCAPRPRDLRRGALHVDLAFDGIDEDGPHVRLGSRLPLFEYPHAGHLRSLLAHKAVEQISPQEKNHAHGGVGDQMPPGVVFRRAFPRVEEENLEADHRLSEFVWLRKNALPAECPTVGAVLEDLSIHHAPALTLAVECLVIGVDARVHREAVAKRRRAGAAM